ncbi:NADH-quinone oxidoreductase subunit NuoE [Modestobacter sp. I12A-02628]|uniref:NADH-quinone oxidoreductase subunit NuoE n=1 Tax=Goekera deserti TaxID=2497753 RepID=A0A7K3W8M2_9ACTN|nr:NADH-quinone oxidoreductase subunit NuoE [Goekera deserti]MPR00576.1 NADH-quinone oxidoreductase subunit NuoE [Goekera deserti]NDI50557.1 NADH-quinone oxidoreductase subunit NuoE [Goekera deserti]NEL52818.1 NADH-quinone oxidoreductase subunit NuoE [Goekera deserti]
MSALPGSTEGTAVTGLDSSPVEPVAADLPPLTEQTRLECRELMARYPQARSALLPMLHLVQSVQGYVSPEGVALCAEELGLTKAEVGAVATFYTMYKRSPTGRHIVSVCTNTLCNVLGGQRIFEAVKADLGVGHDQTTADGSITLEHAECLAACDYAPVVTVDYEFYDQQDVESTRELVAALRRGEKPLPTRGAPLTDFRGVSRQLAGFSQHADAEAARAAVDGPSAGVPTLVGVRLAEERGEAAPPMQAPAPAPTPDVDEPRAATRPTGRTGQAPEKEASDARVAAAGNPAERAGAKTADPDRKGPSRRRTGTRATGTDTPATPAQSGSGEGPAPSTSPSPPTAQREV